MYGAIEDSGERRWPIRTTDRLLPILSEVFLQGSGDECCLCKLLRRFDRS
jgi:hypothetical protein